MDFVENTVNAALLLVDTYGRCKQRVYRGAICRLQLHFLFVPRQLTL